MQLRKMPVASDVNIDELVNRTESYSGAEVGFVTVHYWKRFLNEVRMWHYVHSFVMIDYQFWDKKLEIW